MNIIDISRTIKKHVVITEFGRTLVQPCVYGFANVNGATTAEYFAKKKLGLTNPLEINIVVALLLSKEFAKPLEDECIVLGDDTAVFDNEYRLTDYNGVRYTVYGRLVSRAILPNEDIEVTHYSGNNNDSLFVVDTLGKRYVYFARNAVINSTSLLWVYLKSKLPKKLVDEIEHIECRPHQYMHPDYTGEYR